MVYVWNEIFIQQWKGAKYWCMMQQQVHILQSEKAGLKRLHPTWFQLYDILEEEKW